MTFRARSKLLSFVVRLMALEAGRLEAVRGVTCLAGDLTVLAREFDELLLRACMATWTGVDERSHGNFPRRVRISVAAGAVGDALTVRVGVTRRALGHQGLPPPLFWVVGVEGVVTFWQSK